MSFKKFSSAQDAPRKDISDDEAKPVPANEPANDQSATKPDKTPAEVAPAPKS